MRLVVATVLNPRSRLKTRSGEKIRLAEKHPAGIDPGLDTCIP